MKTIGRVSGDPGVGNCLTAIRQAHNRLHFLSTMRASPTVLASQIELCDVLLFEISDIRSSLARDIKESRVPPPANGRYWLRP
jgi:hypothetical protein